VLKSAALPPSKAFWALTLGAVAAVGVLALTPAVSWIPGITLSFALAWATMTDIDRLILPNIITLPLVGLGLAFAAASGLTALLDRGIAVIAGYAALIAVAYLYRRFRNRTGLGHGDAKLFAAAGAWLGWAALPMVMLVAATGAILCISIQAMVGRIISSTTPLAFGPFLALGFWAIWLVQATAEPF
jgi:leader peptidase (prepilin peptidase) / N-methyltransferase